MDQYFPFATPLPLFFFGTSPHQSQITLIPSKICTGLSSQYYKGHQCIPLISQIIVAIAAMAKLLCIIIILNNHFIIEVIPAIAPGQNCTDSASFALACEGLVSLELILAGPLFASGLACTYLYQAKVSYNLGGKCIFSGAYSRLSKLLLTKNSQ